MTRIVAVQSGSTVMDLQHNLSGRANNGRIVSMTNGVSGETITYTYDSLQRLTAANSSQGAGQSQTFGYDGFGNLTAKGAQSIGVIAATNRLADFSYDANGNQTSVAVGTGTQAANYDVDNLLLEVGSGAVRARKRDGDGGVGERSADGGIRCPGDSRANTVTHYNLRGWRIWTAT